MLWIANMNLAHKPYMELFDDIDLKENSAYSDMIKNLKDFFGTQPLFGPDNQNLIDMLRSPSIAKPYSLKEQLQYIIDKWGFFLGKFLLRLLQGLDLINEEEKIRGFGAGELLPYDYSAENEYERFSKDKEWMPNLVLMAKHTLVWLDQLSKKYQREIRRLDQIPDEELDMLARWGFSGLWLIGLWERSHASREIKQHCGNPDAHASAYSLYDYVIAGELGGNDALQNLKQRCQERGIRLASDMVPNHTGIYSKWVIEHPDWFIQRNTPPFPSYSFSGHNYSQTPGVGIYIEDHYYSKNDASVVFKRVDFNSGETRYIYHGNDGTHMPWNDTAQLNYLMAEVREAVIQTIFHVARSFPIIRFDAAMTLAKKHFQRLWFPVPGSGGDIPSRVEYAMTQEQFNTVFPDEFWREVVDRVAEEVPDTLLLAEAFWMMEGYFVRTLGMHRVYNSAFMNMFKMEDNQKYRTTIKNTIEFEPEILKRFVNFMNNPDEDTAIAQFGKDDKYFGVCLMMATMPGLPMFGHGQIEGFTEKYGMEYTRAYYDEEPDWNLVRRHEREIFPLLRKRYIFAHVDNFYLYDFFAPEGWVNENVFAYSNRAGDEKGLIIYNNKFEHAKGWVKSSAAKTVKNENGDKHLEQKVLGDGLALHKDSKYYTIFKDHITGLEYIRNSKDIWGNGLYIELDAFKYHAFIDFYEVSDNEYSHYAKLNGHLNGRGVTDINYELKKIILAPIHKSFTSILNKENLNIFKEKQKLPDDIENNIFLLLDIIKKYYNYDSPNDKKIVKEVIAKLKALKKTEKIVDNLLSDQKLKQLAKYYKTIFENNADFYYIVFLYSLLYPLGKISDNKNPAYQSRVWIDELLLDEIIHNTLVESGTDNEKAWLYVNLIKTLVVHFDIFQSIRKIKQKKAFTLTKELLDDLDVSKLLDINFYNDVYWFNAEKFKMFIDSLFYMNIINNVSYFNNEEKSGLLLDDYKIIQKLFKAEKSSEYQIEKLLDTLK